MGVGAGLLMLTVTTGTERKTTTGEARKTSTGRSRMTVTKLVASVTVGKMTT